MSNTIRSESEYDNSFRPCQRAFFGPGTRAADKSPLYQHRKNTYLYSLNTPAHLSGDVVQISDLTIGNGSSSLHALERVSGASVETRTRIQTR